MVAKINLLNDFEKPKEGWFSRALNWFSSKFKTAEPVIDRNSYFLRYFNSLPTDTDLKDIALKAKAVSVQDHELTNYHGKNIATDSIETLIEATPKKSSSLFKTLGLNPQDTPDSPQAIEERIQASPLVKKLRLDTIPSRTEPASALTTEATPTIEVAATKVAKTKSSFTSSSYLFDDAVEGVAKWAEKVGAKATKAGKIGAVCGAGTIALGAIVGRNAHVDLVAANQLNAIDSGLVP